MSDQPLPSKCDSLGCDCEGTLNIGPGCHMGAPLLAFITADVLTLECFVCRTVIERFRVTGVVVDL